ncbi:hypothetical protein NM688_g3348 [Phlebia brevispora]|uniref:Uncharacterized protein n=1 Tax=Phlebia brevispora TaxID=194682 RepID=A0ACC1T616_9APHY|nr:hypothetical protein NM688_g3348 [Phlebia brevispora]
MFDYPKARRSDHVDVYKSEAKGEVRVPEPYAWLEQKSPETDQWINDQESLTRKYLDAYPERQSLEDEIRENMNYAKFSAPSLKRDNRWYWYYNSGLQPQSIIYRSKDESLPKFTSEDDGPGGEIFFDPNLLSSDGTASLATTAFSHCGTFFAYGISRSGSDFYTVYVRKTSSPLVSVQGLSVSHDDERLTDEIRFVKFSGIDWTYDSKGFFYQRYPDRQYHGSASDDMAGTETESDKNAMLFYHRLGTKQSEDILVYKDDSQPDWFYGTEVTEVDGRYVLMSISKDTSRKNLLWVADLQNAEIGQNMQWNKVIDEFDAAYDYIANDGTVFYLLTNKDAPQYKLVRVDISQPAERRVFEDVIPEDKEASLETVLAVDDDKFAITYKRNVKDEIYIYTKDGVRVRRVAPDHVGAVDLSGLRTQNWFFATLTSFTTPGVVARYDFGEKDESNMWTTYRTTLVKGLKPDDFEARQVWYTSKDGTKVPMFIVRHRKTEFDGTAPAIQYGYGGFTIPIDPFFSSTMLTFLQRYGAILAVPNIRGGGEFGEEWHLAGTRERKVNCFDDFIAASEYLVENKYAARGKIALNGGSNGGLLVSACVNRAPEGLIGAAVAEFADFTIGRAWTSDYGDPHDPHDFDFIYPISPLHNVPEKKILPATILLTADHDDRVVPLHSFKLAATLQYVRSDNPAPLLIRIDKKAGHGAGKSTDQRIKERVCARQICSVFGLGFMSSRVVLSTVVCGSRRAAVSHCVPLLARCSASCLPATRCPVHHTLRFASQSPPSKNNASFGFAPKPPQPSTPNNPAPKRFQRSDGQGQKKDKNKAQTGRRQNLDIPHRRVRLVDPETNQLGPVVSLKLLVDDIQNDPDRRKWQIVELVTEKPEPIVKLVDRREEYRKQRDHADKAKESKKVTGEKEVQMTWGVAAGDLAHKLKKAREALTQGYKVTIVYAPKKGQTFPTKDEMREKVRKTVELLEDVGQEWKPTELDLDIQDMILYEYINVHWLIYADGHASDSSSFSSTPAVTA